MVSPTIRIVIMVYRDLITPQLCSSFLNKTKYNKTSEQNNCLISFAFRVADVVLTTMSSSVMSNSVVTASD